MNDKMTAAEIGKIWAIHMGNTMSKCVLSYFLEHVDDEEIKGVVINAQKLTNEILGTTTKLFQEEHFPTPIGLTEKDVNPGAPRLFADPFYLYYLKYTAKSGLNLYSTAIPLMKRSDVREFILYLNKSTTELILQINDMMEKKGILPVPPTIPIPPKVSYIGKQSYLNGFFGGVRPLSALEITHLFDNIENNVTSKALLIGFSQVAKNEEVKKFFSRGKKITMNQVENFMQKLHKEDLPTPSLLDDLVETSNISPFSDRLMMTHKIDMFSMKIRSYGNAMSLSARLDLSAMYGKCLFDIGRFVEDGANIMIDHNWMEQPPHAIDREDLLSN